MAAGERVKPRAESETSREGRHWEVGMRVFQAARLAPAVEGERTVTGGA